MQDLNHKIAKGAAWMVLLKFTERALGLVSTVILARLLIPDDFGLIAMAVSIIAVLDILGSFSFDLALIQNHNADKRHYDTAWTFAVMYGVFSALALALLASPTAIFYNDARLEGIIYLLAVGTLFQGFENVGVVAFQKDLNLRSEFVFRTAKKLVGFTLTISLALAYQNYWALAIGTVGSRFAGVFLSYVAHPYRPHFSLAGRKDLFHFSKWMLINNIVLFINSRGVDFVIGKTAGASALGLYSVAYEISNLPTTELVFPISKAVFPGYAKIAHDLPLLRKGFLDVFGAVIVFALPSGIGIAVVAEHLVIAILGPRWISAVPLIQILAIFGLIRACSSNIGSIYLAIGRPRVIAILTVLNIAILAPLLVFTVPQYGAIGAAISVTIAALIQLPLNLIIMSASIGLGFGAIFERIWRPLAAALLMGYVVSMTRTVLPISTIDAVSKLIMLLLIGVATYAFLLLVFWRLCGKPIGSESALLNFILSRRRRAKMSLSANER